MPKVSKRKKRVQRNWRHNLLLLGMAVCLIFGVIFGILWWQELPLAQAERHLEQGQIEQAFALINDFLKNDPHNPRALALKARTLTAMGRWSEAVSIFERVGAAKLEELHALSQALLHQQQWTDALPLLERILSLNPDHIDALHEITACRERLGHFEEALESAERYRVQPGFEARGSLLVGMLQRQLGNRRKAAEAFSKVLQYDPDVKDLQLTADHFFLLYGSILVKDGRPKEALPLLERSASLQPNSEVYVRIAEAHLQIGNSKRAVEFWRRAVEEDSRDPDARKALANEAIQRGAAQEALKWLKPLESSEDLTSSTAYLMQRSYSLLDDHTQSEAWRARTKDLRKIENLYAAIELKLMESPRSFWSRAIHAYRFAESGNWRQAAVLVETLIQKAPIHPFVRDLAQAIETEGSLPSLEDLPFTKVDEPSEQSKPPEQSEPSKPPEQSKPQQQSKPPKQSKPSETNSSVSSVQSV